MLHWKEASVYYRYDAVYEYAGSGTGPHGSVLSESPRFVLLQITRGLTGNGGSTHYAMEDMALFSSLVNMTVCAPADPEQLRQIILKSVDWAGPMAIPHGSGKNNAVLYPEDAQVEIGKAYTACEGSDITIIACGEMVAEAIKISKELKKEGISVRVLDMFTVKPLDREAVIRAAEETGRIITWEDHLMNNGLSSAVSDVLTDNCIALESFKRFGTRRYIRGLEMQRNFIKSMVMTKRASRIIFAASFKRS